MKTSIADILAQKDAEIEKLRNPWQPIETAPKDGREFLVNNCGEYFVCYFKERNGCFFKTGGYFAYFDEPSFWCELPQPPQTKEAKDAND